MCGRIPTFVLCVTDSGLYAFFVLEHLVEFCLTKNACVNLVKRYQFGLLSCSSPFFTSLKTPKRRNCLFISADLIDTFLLR